MCSTCLHMQWLQCKWWWADWGMLMFPLWLLWGTRWLDLQPPGWSPALHGLLLWFTFDVNRKVSWVPKGSWRGGEQLVCAGPQHMETLLLDPRRGWRNGWRRKAPWSLGRTWGRITGRLKCFLCAWRKPKKCSQPNPFCSEGLFARGLLKTLVVVL